MEIEDKYGINCGQINIVIAISSREKRPVDQEYVDHVRKRGFRRLFLWSSNEIEYIEKLVKQVGPAAKCQLYSVIFKDIRQKKLGLKYPAIRGKIGGQTFYTFMIPAKKLLDYAYVHHRDLTGIVAASQVYQRMLRNAKLKEIGRFIDEQDGYFPNSIIVNFSRPIKWDKMEHYENDVSIGTISLPQYYGSAWIIDGQHRLYGAAKAKKEDMLVPVLAFDNLETLEQANLFKEINEKQTSVPRNLLWDLYSDIYRDSTDDKQRLQYQIAETAKRLRESGPLSEYIDIPSMPAIGAAKLSLTTVCSTIEKYAQWKYLKHPSDETRTPDNAARIIGSYYEILKELWPEDWNKGKGSVLISNNGFGVFIMVFQDILNYFINTKQESLLKSGRNQDFRREVRDTFLKPVIEHLKINENMQKDIRSKTGRGPQSENAARIGQVIQRSVTNYSPARMGGLPDVVPSDKPPLISSLEDKARLAEGILREFILDKLKSHYGSEKWWKQGVPGGPKKDADDMWIKETRNKPRLEERQIDLNAKKFEFLGLGELISVVNYGNNWDEIFEPIFKIKGNFEYRVSQIKVLRDPTSHIRQCDDQDILDGTAGLLWLSNCIGAPDLNPHA